ncbi:hypothetical protein Smp_143610 [Schistosoma mansoni]|uniref:hypothetical protein n=1 Tax=Schistosoma mansoni TaxID=6183 RepID=UPI00022DD10C|nr:hypothetical protein Smp_143610 [Schistosoma mansoni]|eukprot:XP_018650522.1 hypothetical protein Smp_143610 [Schistosoma mansoni]
MRELDEQMSCLFQNDTNYYNKRTTQLQQEYNLLTERVGKMAVRLRNLPEQWADFDDKLNHLLDWTNEVEKLFNHLQSDPSNTKNNDEKTAIELASRYRAMLSRFEEMTGMDASAPLIAETLEFRANAVTERKKAIVVREAFEQAVQEDAEMLPNDLESIKRILAEREAMVARLAEERDASLLAMIQHGLSVKTDEMLDWIEPSKNELKATWAEVDKVAETGLKSLRQTAEAFEAFEEHKQRITNLLTGTKHLINGHASASTTAAFTMALLGKDGTIDIDNVTNTLHIDNETKLWADSSLASGIAGVIVASVEEATKAGQEAVRVQTDAILAQLDALNNAESDLKALINAAQTMKMRSTPERASELDATIKQLENQLITAKQELNAKLANLRAANGKWEVFYTSTREVDKLLNNAELNLSNITSVQPLAKGNLNVTELGSAESSAKAAAAELALWYASVNNYLKDLQLSEQRLLSLNVIFKELTHFSPLDTTEINTDKIENTTKILSSTNSFINSLNDLINLRNTHNARQMIHNAKYTEDRNQLLWLASNLTSWSHLKEANEALQSRWESVNYWFIEESQYLDDLHNMWTEWNEEADQFTLQITNIEKDVEQELNNIINDITNQNSKDDLDSKVNKASAYQDRLFDAESYLKAFSFKTEKLLKRIFAQTQIHCRTLLPVDTGKITKSTDQLSSSLTESTLNNTNISSQFTNIAISPHSIAIKYRELEEHLKCVRIQCEKLNNELENQLDARDRLFRDTDRLLQWIMSAEKRMTKLTRIWVAARPPITTNKSYGVLHKPSSIMKQRSDQIDSDKQQLIGVDLSEAYEQLKTLQIEASGPRMIALKELANQIEGEDVDLNDLYNKMGSRPGSNRPGSNHSRPTSDRSRSRRSVSFDLLGKENSFDSTTNDEINRQLHERLIRLLSKLNRLISHLDQRTILCRLTIEYEYCRQNWIQEINALNSRLKTFENNSVVVELDVDKKKKQPSNKSIEDDRKPSVQENEDSIGQQQKQHTEEEINKDEVSMGENVTESTNLTHHDDNSIQTTTITATTDTSSKERITPIDILQSAADDAERILFRKQTIQSGIVYQSEYKNLKDEIDKLKQLINNWQVTLDFTRPNISENEFDETLNDSNLVGPKELDVAVVSVGLMFVTIIDSNWSFSTGFSTAASSMTTTTSASITSTTTTSTTTSGGTTITSDQSTILQLEPFSFFIDIARLSSECDKLHGKLKSNLLHVIGVCENWQQLVEARDRLLEQVKDLQYRSSGACYTVSQLGDPSKTDKPIGIRLTRLGKQLLNWQVELNSAGTITDDMNALQTDVNNNNDNDNTDKTNLPSEAATIIQRLNDLRRAGERIVGLNPARGPNVDSLYNTTVQSIRLCAIYLGEIGRHSILLFEALSKRSECLHQLTEFLDEVEKQSGLIPASEHQSVFGDANSTEQNQMTIVDQQINSSDKNVKRPIPEEIASQFTMFECMDLCRLLSVDNAKEVEQQLKPCQISLDSLMNKQNTYFIQLNQSSSLALQTFNEFQTEICRYNNNNNNKMADTDEEHKLSEKQIKSDPFRDVIINRWQRLHFRLETVIQQLYIRRSAFIYVEDGFKQLEHWLETNELTIETCSSQLAANAATSAILSPFNLHSILPADDQLEYTENPQLILDTFITEVVYYSNLLNSINDRIEADLGDRVLLKKTLDNLEWRLHKLQKSSDHLLQQWNEEYERCEQLKVDLHQFNTLLESINKELTCCFDPTVCNVEDLNSLTMIQYSPTDIQSINIQANNYLLQLCKAQCIRHRLARLRDRSLWLHDRAHLLAIGPSRYHHRSIQPLKITQEEANLSINNENKSTELFTASILLESESVSLNHRLLGLIARSTKSVHILHSKINHIFFDAIQNFHNWFDDLHSRMNEIHSATLSTHMIIKPYDSKQLSTDTNQSVGILSVDVLSSNLNTVRATVDDLTRKVQCESKLDILKELAKIILRSHYIDIEPSLSDHIKDDEVDDADAQVKNEKQPSVDGIQTSLLTAESLLQSVEDKVEQFTKVVDTTENNPPSSSSLPISLLLTKLNSSDVSSIFMESDNSISQLIRLWDSQLTNMYSELKQIELKLDTAQNVAIQSKEYEIKLSENMIIYEKQFKQIILWQQSITIESCKIRLNELQDLLVQLNGYSTELKQAHETFNQLVKLSTLSLFHELNNKTTDSTHQNDDPDKLNEKSIYKSIVLTEIQSRLNTLQSCLEKASQHTMELTTALETQQRTCNDANNWIENVTNQLHHIIKERQETPSNRDTAQKYLDLMHTKLDESKSVESLAEKFLSFHSIFISESNDQLINYSFMLNDRFNVYLNELGTVLNKIQLDLNQWTSYIDSKVRLEKWLNMVESDWKVNQLTDSDEVGDNLTNKMYFVTLYKDMESHESLLNTVISCGNQFNRRNSDNMISTTTNDDQVVLPTEEIQNFRKRFESLYNFVNTRLKLHQNRLERYRKFMEHNQKFEEWLSNTETKLNYMIEDIVGRIEHLIPENESYSITSHSEYDPDLSIKTQFINKDNNLSIYIEKIDKLWLSIMNSAESQLDTLSSLFLSIEKEVENPGDFEIKITNIKNHIFLNLKQKITDLIQNLKEYQHHTKEFLTQLSKAQTYMNNQEKKISQYSTRQLCHSMSNSMMLLTDCSNFIQSLHDSREQLISIMNKIKQTSLSDQNILITNNDHLDKHLNYLTAYLKKLKKCCEDLIQYWQLAVDNHLKFQETIQSCSMEFQMIKSDFIKGCPFNNEMELANIISNGNNHEISSTSKRNRIDQIYNNFLGWLSNLINKLDRFIVISYQSCIELAQITSLTTSVKGYNLVNEQLIELKKSADQLSTNFIELYHQIELTMIEHIKMDQEKYELKNWLNECEQKLIELNKPLERVFQNLSSRSQHLRSFEERQSLVLSNYKTYIVDRVNQSIISDDIKQMISNVSNSELNTDYTNLINFNKELISKSEKITNQNTKFNDLAQSLLSEINTLSDNLRILEDFFNMKSHIVMDNDNNNNKSMVNSQELLWTRDLVQYKINELNEQTRDVSLKNIHEKLNILEEMFNCSVSLNNPEKNLANELINSIKNQLNKLTERIDQQSALLSLILDQMEDMSKRIVQHKEWFSHLVIKVESIETELPVDLESKKTLLVQYQDILTETTEHISEINVILKDCCCNTATSFVSQKSEKITEESTDLNLNLSSHPVKIYPVDVQLVKSLKSLHYDMNQALERVNLNITRWKRAITRHENLIESLKNLEIILTRCITNTFYCAKHMLSLEIDMNDETTLLKFPVSSILSKCVYIIQTYINTDLDEVSRLLDEVNLTYDSVLQDTCPENMNIIKLQIRKDQNQFTNLEHKIHTLQAYLTNLTDRIDLFTSIDNHLNERISNLSNRLQSESINLCSTQIQEIKRYTNIWHGIHEKFKQIHQDYINEMMPLIKEFQYLKVEHLQFLELYKKNFSFEFTNENHYLLEQLPAIESITIQSIYGERNDKLLEIIEFISAVIKSIDSISSTWSKSERKFIHCRSWINGLTKKFMQISQTNLKTDITTTPNISDVIDKGGEVVVTEASNQSSAVSPSDHVLNQLDQYTAQNRLSLLKTFVQQIEEEIPKIKDELKTINSIVFPTPTGLLNQVLHVEEILAKAHSNSEKLYSLEKLACTLEISMTQRKQITTSMETTTVVTHDNDRSGRNQMRLIELKNVTTRYSELVKRVQVVVKQTDSCRDLFNKLMSNVSSTSEWIKQLEQNISNYTNLSGDRYALQTRLELVKKRLDLNLLNKEANDRFTDMNKYAMDCFQQYIPNNHESLELIGITDSDKCQQIYESFLTIPMYCVKLYKMWFDCREKIEFITKSLSDSIETWQIFEVTCDNLQLTCRRIENWLKEQSTWLVDEPEQINEKLELLQLINDRLEVKFSIDAPKYCELSSKSLSTCRHEQQRILELLDESTSQVDLLNSTLKRLPNHHHQLCPEDSATVDENNLSNVHTITTVESKTDSYDLALNCIKNLIVTFNYLQKITRETSDLWNTRLKLFTEWNSKIQNTETNLSKLCLRMKKIKEQFSPVSEELEKSSISNMNLARAQHSKLLYFHSELNNSQRQCTEIQSDAYNQLCSMMNESIETSNQIENHLDTTISIGNNFKTKLNQFTKNFETCLSCINHIKTEFDQSISSIPKCGLLMKSEEENREVQSLIKSRCLILNNLIEQIGDAKQLNDLLIDTLNEKAEDVNSKVAEENRNSDDHYQKKDGQNLIQNLEELLKEAIDLDSFYHLDDINKSSSNDVQHYAYCIARYLIYESIQLREMVSQKLITITNETEEQLKLDSMLNYFEQQLTKCQDELNQIVVNMSVYRSKSFDDNGDTVITSLKFSSLNTDNSADLYWFHLRQSTDNCENRINQLDNCLQCMIDVEKAENWLTINESLSKKVLYVVTTDDKKQLDGGDQQIITETIHDSCINPNMSEQEIKAANDKEILSKQLTNLEQLEINLKEHGIELREQTEQSARCLLFNLIPNSMKLIKDKQSRSSKKSEIIDYINLAIENLLNRYNEYKISLQMIHSNLSEKYLCWSKLDSNLEQMNRWLHTIELQLNTMEMETNSLSTILINDISVHKTDEYFAVHQLNAWSNSKLCILTNLMDEMRRYSETELIQLKELVHAQNSIDEVFKEYSKDGNTSNDVVISLGQNASKRLNDIFEQHHKLKSRLESLIHLNHVILNLCEKFVRKRCEIFQWLISQRRELEGLINQTETYGSQTSLLSSSPVSLNDEVAKLCKLFHKTTCDLEAFKISVSVKYEESLTDVIKLIEELGQMTPLRMEPAETYIIDLKRDVTEFFNQVTDKLEHFRVWNDKWSNFSIDCSSLTQWMSEQESFIISTLNSQSTIELEDSSFQITSSNVVEKELNQLTSQLDRNRQLRIILIGHQPAMESLVVKAQSLIKSRMFSSSAYLGDDGESKASDKSVKSLFTSNMPVGNIAMNIATYIMQRYQTLISICDSRSETSQTAQKMVGQLLNSCRNYDHWACEFRIKLSDVDFVLNSYDSHSIPLQESDRYSSIRLSVVDLETRIESGESFVQLIKDWTDRYITELLVQVNQRRSELETLGRLAKISNENSDHDSQLVHCNGKLKSVSSYAETDYQVLKEMVRSLRNRFERVIQNVNQRSLSREKFTSWIDTTESQLDLINNHMNLSGLSKIILEAPMDDFDRLIEKVINYMLTASESITQLTVDIRKQSAEIRNSDYTDENLQNRFDQLTENIHSTHQDISSCLKLLHQFQIEVQNFSSWISDCENKFIRLSDGDSNQLAIFLQSNSSTMIVNDGDNDAEQILHQLDISCRSSICQLTEAKHKLLIIKEISSSLENRGHQLNKQLIESGEQLTSKLKILEEFSMGGAQIKSVGGVDVGRSLSTLESSDRLSGIIQNYIDQLQCRLIRLDKIQTVFTINLTELADCWSDWKNSFDRLIDWLNGTAANLRRPIFHSLDSLSTKQQLANSLKAFYQDCVGKKADFDMCLLKANHVKSLASSCNLPDQSEQLFEQYRNTLDTAYAALQQMQNSVEIHEQFDQVVSRTTQWLESLASKLNNLSANDNTDRVGLEQNLLTCQNVKQELGPVQFKIDELKKCTEKYIEFEHKLNVMQQVNQLTEKYSKAQKEVEICLVKTSNELQNLRIFHTKIDESKNWILQISLKLMAIHATNPDGPKGVIRLGQAESELRKRLITYREENLKELKLLIANCPSEKDLIIETDRVIQSLFQTPSGVSITVAEQIMENMNRISVSIQSEKVGDKCEQKHLLVIEDNKSTSSQILSANDHNTGHSKTWAELFSLEVVQLESSCENLEVMCKRIKDRLMEQQKRWAKFVSLLIRIDKFLRTELPECQNVNFALSINGLPTNNTTSTNYELSNTKAQISEEKMHALSGLELRRRASHMNEQLEKELKQLDKYIENLQDLKIRWDQQNLCEIEFLNWLHHKQIEFNQIIHTQSSNLLHNKKIYTDSNSNNNYSSQLYNSIDTIQDHLNYRRLLTNEILKATKLTDQLHTDLHEVVKRSIGIDNVQCSMDKELKKIGWEHSNGRFNDINKISNQYKISKQPSFGASHSNLLVSSSEIKQSYRVSTPIPLSDVQPLSSISQSDFNIHSTLNKPLEINVKGVTDWLWYSASSVLPDSSLLPMDANETWEMDQIPAVSDVNEEQNLDRSRSSSRISLTIQRPWSAFRKFERQRKRDSVAEFNVNIPKETKATFKHRPNKLFTHIKPLTTQSTGTSLWRSQSAKVLPLETNIDKISSQSICNISTGIDRSDDSNIICAERYSTQSPMIPMLLRRSISPIVSKTLEHRTHRIKNTNYNRIPSRFSSSVRQNGIVDIHSPSIIDQNREASSHPSLFDPLTSYHRITTNVTTTTASQLSHLDRINNSLSHSFLFRPPVNLSQHSLHNQPRRPLHSIRVSGLVSGYDFSSPSISEFENVFCAGRPQPMGASISDNLLSPKLKSTSEHGLYDSTRRRATEPFQFPETPATTTNTAGPSTSFIQNLHNITSSIPSTIQQQQQQLNTNPIDSIRVVRPQTIAQLAVQRYRNQHKLQNQFKFKR